MYPALGFTAACSFTNLPIEHFELEEENGLVGLDLTNEVGRRSFQPPLTSGEFVWAEERFFGVRVERRPISDAGWTEDERTLAMTISIVSTAERPDLAETTGTWRWEAFFREEIDLLEMLRLEAECASNGALMPTVLVLLDGQQPVGMAALCLDDLETRPDLNPWLAGVYVDPAHRGKGHALRLVNALEALAQNGGVERLYLYTSTAQGLYYRAGWTASEAFERQGKHYFIMQKTL